MTAIEPTNEYRIRDGSGVEDVSFMAKEKPSFACACSDGSIVICDMRSM